MKKKTFICFLMQIVQNAFVRVKHTDESVHPRKEREEKKTNIKMKFETTYGERIHWLQNPIDTNKKKKQQPKQNWNRNRKIENPLR